MHPILARFERLNGYLVTWAGIAVLLAGVKRQGLSWIDALAFWLPLCLVYAWDCLSAWYVCRATPLKSSGTFRVFAASALAATAAATIWVVVARLWNALLTTVPAFADAGDRYLEQTPVLFVAGVLLYLLAIAVHHAFAAFEAATEAERRQLELEVLARDAELRALRAQIDPHFLYNSLNSISALTASNPVGARRMCVLLADFLRSTLQVATRERIPLAEELALAERFLNIEQVRFGDRLRIDRDIDERSSACLVPPLVLQPLVENAVTHGIAGLVEGGAIRLGVSRDNGRCAIVLENPYDADDPAPDTAGIGLDNVRRRLSAMFGGEATVRTDATANRFRVELRLPCTTDD